MCIPELLHSLNSLTSTPRHVDIDRGINLCGSRLGAADVARLRRNHNDQVWCTTTRIRDYATESSYKLIVRNPHLSWVYRTPYSQPTWSGRPSSDIKGDLQYVHMPAFVDLPNGSLALAWQGSVLPYEGSHLQALYWSTSSDNGRSWTMPSVLRPPRNQLPLWGPVWHTNGTSLVLFYSASNNQCRWGGETGRGAWSPGGDILMSVSLDNGATWSQDRTILSFAEGGRPIPKVLANQMVVTERGRWVLPFWYEQGGGCRDAPELHGVPGVLVSDDEVRALGDTLNHPAIAVWTIAWHVETRCSGKCCFFHTRCVVRVVHGAWCASRWEQQRPRPTHGSLSPRW